jgi:hypothetical protein
MGGGDDEEPMPQPVVLNVGWDLDRRERLGRTLGDIIRRYYSETQDRRERAKQWRRDFKTEPPGTNNRWEGCADLNSGLTNVFCSSHSTRLNSQILRTVPPVSAVTRDPALMDQVADIDAAMASILEETNWEAEAANAHNDLPVVGTAFIAVTYENETCRRPRVVVDHDERQSYDLLRAGVEPGDAFVGGLQTDKKGRPKQKLIWENVTVRSGVKIRFFPWEDGIVFPTTIQRPEEAYCLGERKRIRGADLLKGAREGLYIQDAVDELLKRKGDPLPDEREEQLHDQGLDPDGTSVNYDEENLYEEYECHDLCYLMDANGDKEMEWCVLTVHSGTDKVLRHKYLPYEHGKPFYNLLRYEELPGQLWGFSVAEKISCFQAADAAVMCALADQADLKLNVSGNFFYDTTSGLNPAKIKLRLAEPIEVDDVRGILPFPQPSFPAEHYQLSSKLKEMCELLTASSNPTLGRTAEGSQTLGEIQIVAGASSMVFEEKASQVARQWASILDQVRWLEAQYGGSGPLVPYRISAAPGKFITQIDGSQVPAAMGPGGQLVPAPNGTVPGFIDRELLKSKVDLVPTGLAQLSDMQTRISVSTQVQGMLLANPITGQDPRILAMALDVVLQAVRYPRREEMMGLVQQNVDKILGMEQAQQQAQALMGEAMLTGQGAPGGGGVAPTPSSGANGGPPEAQAQAGFPKGGSQGTATGVNGTPMPPSGTGGRTLAS